MGGGSGVEVPRVRPRVVMADWRGVGWRGWGAKQEQQTACYQTPRRPSLESPLRSPGVGWGPRRSCCTHGSPSHRPCTHRSTPAHLASDGDPGARPREADEGLPHRLGAAGGIAQQPHEGVCRQAGRSHVEQPRVRVGLCSPLNGSWRSRQQLALAAEAAAAGAACLTAQQTAPAAASSQPQQQWQASPTRGHDVDGAAKVVAHRPQRQLVTRGPRPSHGTARRQQAARE